jgi:hypothetical protein
MAVLGAAAVPPPALWPPTDARAQYTNHVSRSSRIAMAARYADIAPDSVPVLVHSGSERTVEPVRQGSSFAEKAESHPDFVVVVQRDCAEAGNRDACFVDGQRQSLDATRLANVEPSGRSPSRGDAADEPKQAWGAAGRGQHEAISRLGWR